MIYLDNAATTFPKPNEVYEAMDKMNRYGAVNAGRGSYKLAQDASKLIQDTKQMIRALINVDNSVPVVFSPSITVAINQIVNGINLISGATVYVSPYEHNAVARSIYALSKKKNLIIKEIPINEGTLELDIDRTRYEFAKNKPDAVVLTHMSNVTGYILPVEEIFKEAKRYNAITVLDTAQSLGLIKVDARQLNADLIAFAGHKSLYGPIGIGGFVNVSNVELDEFIVGGTGSDSLNLAMPLGQESKYESASKNIVAIAGLKAALTVLEQEKVLMHEKKITAYLLEKLKRIKGVNVITYDNPEKQVGIISLTLQGHNSEEIGTILDEDYGIAVRTGYHCAPFIHKYIKSNKNLGTIRVGIGQYTSTKDIDSFCVSIDELCNE